MRPSNADWMWSGSGASKSSEMRIFPSQPPGLRLVFDSQESVNPHTCFVRCKKIFWDAFKVAPWQFYPKERPPSLSSGYGFILTILERTGYKKHFCQFVWGGSWITLSVWSEWWWSLKACRILPSRVKWSCGLKRCWRYPMDLSGDSDWFWWSSGSGWFMWEEADPDKPKQTGGQCNILC